MATTLIDIRAARPTDAPELAAVHDATWISTYQGLIPVVELTRMVQRRGPTYWQKLAARRSSNLLVLVFDGTIAGYTSFGANRSRRIPTAGEIYELYLRPDHQGLGLGKTLFSRARKTLRANGLQGLCVWALDANETAVEFYRGLGGQPLARGSEKFGTVRLTKTAFVWPVKAPKPKT